MKYFVDNPLFDGEVNPGNFYTDSVQRFSKESDVYLYYLRH